MSRNAITILFLASVTAAQDAVPPEPVVREVSAWMKSDFSDRKLLERAVEVAVDAGAAGFEHLARVEREAPDDRKPGARSLITHAVLGFMERQNDTGMIYAGQYDPLRRMQPHAGEFLISLVIDTPDWFPENMRAGCVPALRDVYPKGPDAEAVRLLRAVAEDEDFEAQGLRLALTYALAQWGQRDLVDGRIAELEESAGERKNADELHFVGQLANLRYLVRDYEAAGKLWLEFLRGTEKLGAKPAANDYYNAACSLSLAESAAAALAELGRCAEMIAKGEVDTRIEIDRKMFETDPDLRGIRTSPRFSEIVIEAFGEKKKGEKSGR